ncbi:hypothetical protein DH2020_016549 [Rehmannia glutinosa]|uniref:Carboxypeptidase n=1 Tax=Rehmannia glutinosa TaxID=99300 RepID=A0ABR0WRR8_REHGL
MVSQPWPILVIILALQISVITKVKSHYEADKIASLPGQPKVNFQQYSGYITIDEKQKRSYFYYFVEAEIEPASKPLVLWLNGGPGCSSIGAGAFSEHGPFQPSGNVLVKNNYSWNKARDNLIFLEKWFEKFPEFKSREFYITGESYGGKLRPNLNTRLFKSHKTSFIEISRFVDTYDVTLDVCLSSVLQQSEQDEPKIDVCVEDETNVYLNRKDVQKAFHARLIGVKRWSICSDILHYEMQNLEIPTIGILGSLVKSGIRVLVYSGDQDSVIPLTGTRTLVNGLAKDMGLNTTQPYSAWLLGGHKSMVTFYHLQLYEELHMKHRFLNRRDRSFFSVHSLEGSRYHESMA